MYREIYEMCNLQYLPLDKSGIEAHYEGSIDKTGFNSDWDWELYKEDNKYYPGLFFLSIWFIAIIHKLDEFQIDVTVFYIGYNSSAVLDMSEIRKPTTRWDVADRLPEKDIKVVY